MQWSHTKHHGHRQYSFDRRSIVIIITIIFTLPAQASQWAARVGFSSST
jgi:hypothetical protein